MQQRQRVRHEALCTMISVRSDRSRAIIRNAVQSRTPPSSAFGTFSRQREKGKAYAAALPVSPWNCSSSVEPFSATVDDWLPWIVCVTASK